LIYRKALPPADLQDGRNLMRKGGASNATLWKVRSAIALRAEGFTLQCVGRILGCSRQRTEQLLKLGQVYFEESYVLAMAARAAITQLRARRIKGFKKSVYRWLREAGYIRCNACHFVRCAEKEFSARMRDGSNPAMRCRACNRALRRKWTAANQDKYRDVRREYNRLYVASEKGKAAYKRSVEKRRTTGKTHAHAG